MSAQRFRSKAEADFIRMMTKRGWQRMGRSGSGHERLQWPATQFVLTVPSTADGRSSLFAKILKLALANELDAV